MERNYKNIDVVEFDYRLEDKRIAKHPLKKRDISKLLVYKDKEVSKSTFSLIDEHLSTGDLLVFNNTKVVQARLLFTKATGATIEIFLLNPVNPKEYQQAFDSRGYTQWNCIVGNIKRWKGETLAIDIPELGFCLKATMEDRSPDGALVNFFWDDGNVSFAQIIESCGMVPIPPYLNRNPVDGDKNRYQTVYAKPEGSVAAPTAGLHFTEDLINGLKTKGVNFAETTLHVGAGTFRPVSTNTIGEHEMHTERIYITLNLIEALLGNKRNLVAVGTTSMRTLESIYWLGVKILESKINGEIFVDQWDGYTLPSHYATTDALSAVKDYMNKQQITNLSGSTRMIIVPGYKFRMVDVLITNFHQPRSTLLLLVAAFIGDDWRRVYDYALENDFRFLSYGDSSVLFKKE